MKYLKTEERKKIYILGVLSAVQGDILRNKKEGYCVVRILHRGMTHPFREPVLESAH